MSNRGSPYPHMGTKVVAPINHIVSTGKGRIVFQLLVNIFQCRQIPMHFVLSLPSLTKHETCAGDEVC